MQLSARWQAVIEILGEVFEDKRPCDNIVNEYLRMRKYIGSSDRRFIVEEVWNIVRNRRKLEFEVKSLEPRLIVLAYLKEKSEEAFGGGSYGAYPLSVNEKAVLDKVLLDDEDEIFPPDVEAECPKWLFDKIKDANLLKTLNEKAPADFRVNVKSRDSVIEGLEKEGFEFIGTPFSPIGVRSLARVNLNNCMMYKEGDIEVQDEASQIVSILCDVKEDEKIIDYCSGAGGKALAMSYLLNNKGKVFVHDIDWNRLEGIKDRALRLRASNIEIVKEVIDKDYDKFVIDAPCSGTGTWRRSPDAKFRLSPNRLKDLNKTQLEILETAYNHTKSGGKIVYITCSVLEDENENVVDKFLKKHNNVLPVNVKDIWDKRIGLSYPCRDEFRLRMSPLNTNTDGFFVAIMQKN